jgi:Calcineurin-like phosphoesterase
VAAPVFAVGDVHGHRDVLAGLLRDAGLVDAGESWTGADARLWLVGDLVDRGPDGIGAIELVRRLEGESGGAVRCLLGNHEAMILAALRFGDEETSFGEQTFREIWTLNGGVDSDLDALTPEHVAWLTALPPLAREGDWLVVHADTTAYLELGTSIDAVARATSTALATGDAASVDELLGILSDRMRLGDPEAVQALVSAYGGSRIVHGHTPIASVLHAEPAAVTAPLHYGDGRVVNIDHCLFAGGPGFVVELEGGPGPEA